MSINGDGSDAAAAKTTRDEQEDARKGESCEREANRVDKANEKVISLSKIDDNIELSRLPPPLPLPSACSGRVMRGQAVSKLLKCQLQDDNIDLEPLNRPNRLL